MKILLIVVAIIAVAVFVFFMGGQPPLRGAGQLARQTRRSSFPRARPAFTFVPAADMRLQGWGTGLCVPKRGIRWMGMPVSGSLSTVTVSALW